MSLLQGAVSERKNKGVVKELQYVRGRGGRNTKGQVVKKKKEAERQKGEKQN